MKTNVLTFRSGLASVALLTVFTVSGNAAEWGSLRGSNNAQPSGPRGSPVQRQQAPSARPAPQATPPPQRTAPTPTGRQNEQELRSARERVAEANHSAEVSRQQAQRSAAELQRSRNENLRANRSADLERNRNGIAFRTSRAAELDQARRHEQATRDRRHLDLHEDRQHAFQWAHFHPGMFINVLPFGYYPLYLQGAPYYYYEGVYYEPAPSGYEVVIPPDGLIVPALPPGVETVIAGGVAYYYAGGVFYVQQPNGYQVVQAPLGVTVSTLPPDAVPVTINGTYYYQARGVYYLPIMQDGVTVFITAQP